MSKTAALRSALKVQSPAEIEQAEAPAVSQPEAPEGQRASRVGKKHIGAWLSMQYMSSLRAIQMKDPSRDVQSLLAEALNELFTKHNVPTVRD